MSMGMEFIIYLAYAAGMLLVYLTGRYLMVPLKWMVWILLNSTAGIAVMMVMNYIGSPAGIFVPVNLITAMTAGVLGIPGMVMLAVCFL